MILLVMFVSSYCGQVSKGKSGGLQSFLWFGLICGWKLDSDSLIRRIPPEIVFQLRRVDFRNLNPRLSGSGNCPASGQKCNR